MLYVFILFTYLKKTYTCVCFLEEVSHLTNCSELEEGSEHHFEISEERVVKIKIAFRLFTKVIGISISVTDTWLALTV